MRPFVRFKIGRGLFIFSIGACVFNFDWNRHHRFEIWRDDGYYIRRIVPKAQRNKC
jgi:hypothetical protein